jgi:hypothetical protein
VVAPQSVWDPILSGHSKARALDAVFAIAADVERISGGESATQLFDSALLLAYLSRLEPSGKWRDCALTHLNRAIDLLGPESRTLGMYYGLCGSGWVIEHISGLLGEEEESIEIGADESEDSGSADEQNAPIDRFITRALAYGPWNGSYDLSSGLVGFGVYFVERLPARSAATALRYIVEHLEKRAEVSHDGIAWHTPPERLSIELREFYPCGYYDLSVINGAAGVIGFLAQLLDAGIERHSAQRLLDGAMNWLLVRRRSPDKPSRYGLRYIPGIDGGDDPFGWCYGDLGIAAITHRAMVHESTDDRSTAVDDLLIRCLKRTPGGSRIDAPGIQNGAMGIGHVFNRLYQTSRDERFKAAAQIWFEYGLVMRHEGCGTGGFFRAGWPKEPENTGRDTSFLTGAVGIALALLSAAAPVQSGWDRRLLLSGTADTPLR